MDALRWRLKHWSIKLGHWWVIRGHPGILIGNGKRRRTIWLTSGLERTHHTDQNNIDQGGLHIRWHIECW